MIEDACSALGQCSPLGLGHKRRYSFQSQDPARGGGAILTNDEAMANKCFAFHNCCRPYGRSSAGVAYDGGRNTNARITELQAALLLGQLPHVEQRAKTRAENAAYLSSMLREIPGIVPARLYEGCTRSAYHLYMFRYEPEKFANLPRNKFIKALRAEGVPCSDGYGPLKAGFIRDALNSRGYKRVYGRRPSRTGRSGTRCPENDRSLRGRLVHAEHASRAVSDYGRDRRGDSQDPRTPPPWRRLNRTSQQRL